MADVLGVSFDNLTMDALIESLETKLKSREKTYLAFSNPEFVIKAQTNKFLLNYLNEFVHYNLADGIGVVLHSSLAGEKLEERITGTDFTLRICELSHRKNYSLYFLGGSPGTAEKAIAQLKYLYPGANVAGSSNGYDLDNAVENINSVNPDILMVCLGCDKQEKWIYENRERLTPCVIFGNGGALDYYAGNVKRAPNFLQRIGCEWLYRLSQDFTLKRIMRQVKTIPMFIFKSFVVIIFKKAL